MHRSGNDFVYIASLPKGRHAYKFIVDEDWRFAPDQLTVADTLGNINNYVDLTHFTADDDAGARGMGGSGSVGAPRPATPPPPRLTLTPRRARAAPPRHGLGGGRRAALAQGLPTGRPMGLRDPWRG